jgi:hypothetical protein
MGCPRLRATFPVELDQRTIIAHCSTRQCVRGIDVEVEKCRQLGDVNAWSRFGQVADRPAQGLGLLWFSEPNTLSGI